MKVIAGIRFHKGGRIYHFDPNGIELKKGDMVVVETSFGKEVGEVVNLRDMDSRSKERELLPVIRAFDESDYGIIKEQEKEKARYLKIAVELVAKHDLNMKILDANFGFDESKVTFIFSSESRVDFRQLVKDLTTKLKKQVVLRQIGPKDTARFLGGFGRCGRPFCCSSFLQNLESITMDMAKSQNLAGKGSGKISGVCGKLMCCLAYEAEVYESLVKNLPELGSKIKTKKGMGVVIDQNIIKQSVLVEVDKDKSRIEVQIGEKVEKDDEND
ncbi:MAG TPA: regulatory iron-sulfur-containing complex subunit RicT [Patescibacteria group bacterium]|nr:regulatory iron-sulfur-containing complex subunit RicT [Patescibacteria group bacterium]